MKSSPVVLLFHVCLLLSSSSSSAEDCAFDSDNIRCCDPDGFRALVNEACKRSYSWAQISQIRRLTCGLPLSICDESSESQHEQSGEEKRAFPLKSLICQHRRHHRHNQRDEGTDSPEPFQRLFLESCEGGGIHPFEFVCSRLCFV